MAAARALPVDACDQMSGDSVPHLATRSLGYTPTRAFTTYTPSRSLSYSPTRGLPFDGTARRAQFDAVDDITIDEFAAPRRCQARRAIDSISAVQGAVFVAAIAGPVARATEAMRAAESFDDDAPTETLSTPAVLATGSTVLKPSAFTVRRVHRRRNALGIAGLTAAITLTGLGVSVHAVSADDAIDSTAIVATATPDAAAAAQSEDTSRDSARPDLEAAASLPVMSLTAEPSIEGIMAPGQNAPKTPAEALATAASMVGNQNYSDMCLALVSAFYGYTSAGINSAQDAAAVVSAAGMMHTDMSQIPVGALIWYDGTPAGNPYGHVAMYAGDGMIYSNGTSTGVGTLSINTPATDWNEPIIGWSAVWLPGATK